MDSRFAKILPGLVIGLLCLLSGGTALHYLLLDLQDTGQGHVGKPIATIAKKQSTVRRKNAKSLLWSHVEPGSTLFEKDSIQVGPSSRATIELNDKSTLEIGENSLIVLDNKKDLSVNFLKGSFVLRQEKGDVLIQIDKQGNKTVEKLPVKLLSPSPFYRTFTAQGEKALIEFNWKTGELDEQAKKRLQAGFIEISLDRKFGKKTTDRFPLSDAPDSKIQANLKSGHYYWRLFAEKEALTETREVFIDDVSPLKTLSPTPKQTLIATGSTSFQWVPGNEFHDLGTHTLELSHSEDFQVLSLKSPVVANLGSATVKDLATGTWYWRIHSKFGKVEVTSQPQEFFIEAPKKIEIALIRPDGEEALELAPLLRLSWNAPQGDFTYFWKVETIDGKPVIDGNTRGTSALWKSPRPGKFRWSVRAEGPNQSHGESPWNKFAILEGKPLHLSEPPANKEFLTYEEKPKFHFKWQADPKVTENGYWYEIQIAKEIDFGSLTASKKLRENSISSEALDLPFGTFFWRVRLIDETDFVIKTSTAWKFKLDLYPTLRAPTSIESTHTIRWDANTEEKDPVVQWESVPGATGYEITVTGPKGASSSTTTKNSYRLGRLRSGKYQVQVRSIDKAGRKGEPQILHTFEIFYSQLKAPKVYPPEVR